MKIKNLAKKIVCYVGLAAALCYLMSGPSENTIKHKVVRLTGKIGMCSGEQIKAPSGVNYILTAGHCRKIAEDGSFTVVTEDGQKLKRKLIAEDSNSDLLLVEGLPNTRGLDVADFALAGEHARAFTHGSNLDTYKTEGYLVQKKEIQIISGIIASAEDEQECTLPKFREMEMYSLFSPEPLRVCILDVLEEVTTVAIVPGSSGGPIVNDNGELIGVASATDGLFGYFITINDIHNFIRGY